MVRRIGGGVGGGLTREGDSGEKKRAGNYWKNIGGGRVGVDSKVWIGKTKKDINCLITSLSHLSSICGSEDRYHKPR